MLKRRYMLLCPDDGGQGGNGSLLTTPGTGGTAPNDSGNGGTNTSSSGGGGGAGNSTPNPTPQGTPTADWKSGLPKELQDDASIKKFTDISALAGGYVNLQKLIGKDKIVIPTSDSGDDEWRSVLNKLGLPEDETKYEVKFKDEARIDKQFTDEFKKTAFKMGVLPKHAQGLADWFSEVNMQAETRAKQEHEKTVQANLGKLKTEWGAAYEHNISRAQNIISKFADDSTKQYLDKSGLGNDANLIKFLAQVGDAMFKEGKIVADQGTPTMTPKEAQDKIQTIYNNPDHPYFKREHPGHKAAIEEMTQLLKVKKA